MIARSLALALALASCTTTRPVAPAAQLPVIHVEHTCPHGGAHHLEVADAALGAGAPREAAAAYRLALAHDPGSPEALGGLALAARAAGDVHVAAAALAVLVELAPTEALACVQLGRLRLEAGDREGARALAWEAMRRDPAGAEGHLLRAEIHLAQGEDAAALSALHAAVELQPDHERARRLLARQEALALAGGPDEARLPDAGREGRLSPKVPGR